MLNFDFISPTRFIFGKDQEEQVGAICKEYGATKVLVHYSEGPFEQLVGKVKKSITEAGLECFELGGVKPNPRIELAEEGIKLVRKEGIDLIVAVGGGSTIDSSKCIGFGALYEGDVKDFYIGKAKITETLPVGCVLTNASSGSEGSRNSLMNIGDGKRAAISELIRPKFAVMNPEITFTLPPFQTACGIVDMFSHNMERFFSCTEDTYFTDQLLIATMKTVLKYGPIAMKEPKNYNARAQLMWAGTLSQNNLLGVDRKQDWGVHFIEDAVSAKCNNAHGAGLAILTPVWMKYVYKNNIPRFVQFAVEVMGIQNDYYDPEGTAYKGILAVEEFLSLMNMPKHLTELGFAEEDCEKYLSHVPVIPCGSLMTLDKKEIVEILKLAL